jgi:hypothetical protein
MRLLLLLALLAPGAAGANIIELEYWGTVLYVTGEQVNPGDSINGRFRIDTALAPTGDFQGGQGHYQVRGDSPLFIDRSNFISDPDFPFCGCSRDSLLLSDGDGNDVLLLVNYEQRLDGAWIRQELEFQGGDYLNGGGLDQHFEFDEPTTTFGRLLVQKAITGTGTFVQAVINRVRAFTHTTAPPASCHA